MTENIILTSDLITLRENLAKRSIVLATGCFDILHIGHLHFLKDAAMQGDVLVVGVNSDRSVKMIKGPTRPIALQGERVSLIASFRFVAYAFVYDNIVADDCILNLKPDVFVAGEESIHVYPSESATAKKVGARIHIVRRIIAPSTTSIIKNLSAKA